MPVNVNLPFNLEFSGGTTTSYVSILGTKTSYFKSSTTRDSQCLLVEVLLSISSTFCMTTLFQTIPPSEILNVLCSHSLFYSVSREKGLVQRPPGARIIWEIFFTMKKWKDGLKAAMKDDVTFYLFRVQFGALLRPWKAHFQGWSLKKMQKVLGFTIT